MKSNFYISQGYLRKGIRNLTPSNNNHRKYLNLDCNYSIKNEILMLPFFDNVEIKVLQIKQYYKVDQIQFAYL